MPRTEVDRAVEQVERASGRWRVSMTLLRARPRLGIALGAGLAVGFACAFLLPGVAPSTCAIAGWDTLCVVFLVLAWIGILGDKPAEIRARAAQEDEGQAVILTLVLAACVASLAVIAIELSQARNDQGWIKGMHIAVAVGTVMASWLLMQAIFALHYAHEYYGADRASGGDRGGLAFPGKEEPDYWDFLHFAIIIGVASQTADIAFTAKGLRRLGTLHSLIAFVFNTLIVALTINLVAGLF